MNIAQWVRSQARFLPDKTAIIFEPGAAGIGSMMEPEKRYRLTYAELDNRVSATVGLLQNHFKLRKGERISWLGLNHPDMFVLLLAAARLGVVVVPLSWRLSVEELSYIVTDCEPKVLFHDQHESEKALALSRLCEEFTGPICVSLDDESSGSGFNRLLEEVLHGGEKVRGNGDISVEVNDNDPCLIVYTSGTTGRPKGAVLPHRAMVCNALMSQHMYDLNNNEVVLNVLPLFHVGGINIQPLPALMFGATLVLHQQFHPVGSMKAIQVHGVSLINTVPTILQAMQNTAEWQTDDLRSLKSISIGSTDVPRSLIDTVHEKGLPLVQVYGATETGPIAIYQRPEESVATVVSIGRVGLLCEVMLVDSSGREVGVDVPGEICIRGDNILSNYWRNDIATKQVLNDGWFRTGDVAHVDGNGNYWFDDRLKHVIISGGENIYPAEIERVIAAIDGVEAVAVVGRKSSKWGEIPVAAVVTNVQEENGMEFMKATIQRRCEVSLGKFKLPKKVFFVEALPRNAMGKVIVGEVRKLVCDDQ